MAPTKEERALEGPKQEQLDNSPSNKGEQESRANMLMRKTSGNADRLWLQHRDRV